VNLEIAQRHASAQRRFEQLVHDPYVSDLTRGPPCSCAALQVRQVRRTRRSRAADERRH
jgi:hypothetical protein